MFDDAFTKLDSDDVASVLNNVNPLLQGTQYKPDDTTIMTVDMPFYHGYQFIDIADHTVHPLSRHYAIYSDDDIQIIDFTNDPIYAMNAKAPILLEDDTVFDYVRFFFRYVSGKHGRFLVVENVDDIAWKEDPPPNARQAIAKMIEPLTLKDKQEDGTYILSAFMVFKDGLFQSDVVIKPDGMVSLANEQLMIEDMPILDDVVGS